MLFCHSSQTFSRQTGLSASSRDFTGSSMMTSSAGLPVMPERMPRLMSPPRKPSSSSAEARFTPPGLTPKTVGPKRESFSLLRRRKRSASSSL